MSTEIIRYVLVREDGKYVARSGSSRSYTARLEDAAIFGTRTLAERNRCGNEKIRELGEILFSMGGR